MTFKLLIVDDEPLAHQVLLHHLQAHPDLQLVAQCYSAAEAMAVLAQQPIDLILLDIQLPVLTGLQMLKLLAKPPQVILVTAYAEYALDGFALDVTDYLLKPVSGERLALALDKVRRRAGLPAPVTTPAAAGGNEHIVLKVDRELRRFDLASICCFEGYGNYVKVWQGQQMTLASSTLKALMEQTAAAGFIQVHKSFLVNPSHVLSLDSQLLKLSNLQQIRIGEAFKAQARRIFTPR
ncbi:response regulator [Rheinheimera texasensis]|uniref:LytR/AlgR family response regulator transcription factor n=1 Tax=Rheinheimera texasensis TaxID=306205 RepID=UPI0032B281DF